MEARTLKNKKTGLKGRLKNIITRPDPTFWPLVSDSNEEIIKSALFKHKVDIPIFKKPHWQQLKLIEKNERPKPPKIKKVEGLLFGINECTSFMQCDQCSAVILEGCTNPRLILQPVIDTCIDRRIPVVCLNGLKDITSTNFGIRTSCLGIKKGALQELAESICEIAKIHKLPEDTIEMKEQFDENFDIDSNETLDISEKSVSGKSLYLFRTDKSRVFIPPSENVKTNKEVTRSFFLGDDKKRRDKKKNKDKKKLYKQMIIKSIKGNKNRNVKIQR